MTSAALIYVVDPPHLMIESILLSASVRRHMPDVDLIAYCPAAKQHLLPRQMHEFYHATRTELRFIKTEGMFDPYYKQGNKLMACADPRPHDFTIFLDTDTAIWRPFDLTALCTPGMMHAAPEGRYTWGKEPGQWDGAYGVFGFAVPEERVTLARTYVSSPPYFNAGVVGFANDAGPDFDSFGACWLETAQILDKAGDAVPHRRPWLDQIALPVALQRSRMQWSTLGLKYNLSLPHRPLTPDLDPHRAEKARVEIEKLNSVDPYILHYHTFNAGEDLVYAGYLDELVRSTTVLDRVADLDFVSYLGVDPGEIMARFHALKQIPAKERTEEQALEFTKADADKKWLKARMHDPERYVKIWPESLVPASTRAAGKTKLECVG
jgi:hypothetical protein